jgi:hypothetical protein
VAPHPNSSSDALANQEDPEFDHDCGDGGVGLVFWMLIGLSLCGFTPCMILPAWREYQTAELNARVREAEVAELQAEVSRRRRLLDAAHNDPAVVSRLAQRELGYRRPGEIVIPVAVEALPPTEDEDAAVNDLTPAEPPVAIRRVLDYAPQWDYDALFCESPARETILGLSTVLFISAFIIFWPKVSRHDEPQTPSAGS